MLRPPSQVRIGLTTPVLVAGAEPRLIMLNMGILVFMFMILHAWWWIGVTWIVHQALKALAKSDPFARLIYIRYQMQANRYEPWPDARPRRGLRPLGAGRGRL